ncbi:serine/threonine/tyrosine-interacting-like protein 2 [Microcaecilia unicolor]|uniref:Inactive dual specificity phosphatase 27 n=1 Tax=Microcaecilia unicolor TaxID=1415580 RepID=A0A6P7XWL1_9AMPH|nr:inactive dual specificity phosphatase 27 [Microcaecilia unicolor]
MATGKDSEEEQVVPDEGDESDVRAVQAHYLRSPSPSRCSVVSDTFTESIFMEPIHLSSAMAAKQIINEELKPKEVKIEPTHPEMLERAEQLLMEDLYNRVKEIIDDRSLFNTPCVMDLQRALIQDHLEAPMNSVDEVWPNVFIAEKSVAVNKGRLKRMGITHILNAGHGTSVFTGPDFYAGMEIQYLGIEVDDFQDVDISQHLRKGAEFLDEALLTCRGKVLVSSEMGISRSAVLVAAYLMIFHHMPILEALMAIRKKRAICPNDGFLKQLRELNEKLLEEREDFDKNSSMDDGSVIEAKSHSIMMEERDSGSIVGAKVHSIMVEEEDTTSNMGSLMSSMAKSSVISKQPTLIDEDEEERLYEEWRKKQGLPPRELPNKDEGEKCLMLQDQDDIHQMIQEWQHRNEKYRALGPEEDGDSVMDGMRYCPSQFSDIESVSSLDIQTLREQLKASGINKAFRNRTDSVSTENSMWSKRLQEIEKEAAKKYHSKNKSEDDDSETERRMREEDEESVFSETSSFYNFCKKNKDKLTPLERWRIKRIQFGFHKKDSQSTEASNTEESGEQQEREEKDPSDANLTAYQAWKIKHQQKTGSQNKDEIVELIKGEDTASAKRKQRRAEILERSKQTLEESQSLCNWETESAMSGSIPLSAFWPIPPGARSTGDSASVLSMQSNRSSVPQQSTLGFSQLPTPPLPNLAVGPGDLVSLTSIQNWIANMVSETIAQKQNEIMMASHAPSVLSTSTKSLELGRNTENDKVSLISLQNGLPLGNSMVQPRDMRNIDTQSAMSCDSSFSLKTEESNSRRKVAQTSKPLYSLFQDDIDLTKLNRKEKEAKIELSERMDKYKMEKITTDNKRSTLFKKKKARDDEEEEDFKSVGNKSYRSSCNQEYDTPHTASAFSGHFANTGTLSLEVESNVNKWLSGLKNEEQKPTQDWKENGGEKYTRRPCTWTEINTEASNNKFSRSQAEQFNNRGDILKTTSRFSSTSTGEDKEKYCFTKSKVSEIKGSQGESSEPFLGGIESGGNPVISEPAPNRTRTYHFEELPNPDSSELGAKRKFNQRFTTSEEDKDKDESNRSEEGKYTLGRWAQYKKSTDEGKEMDDDEIIAAWRSRQEETKTKLLRRRKEE